MGLEGQEVGGASLCTRLPGLCAYVKVMNTPCVYNVGHLCVVM